MNEFRTHIFKLLEDMLTAAQLEDGSSGPLVDKFFVLMDGNERQFSSTFCKIASGLKLTTNDLNRGSSFQRLLAVMEAEDEKARLEPTSSSGDALLPLFEVDDDDKARMLKLCSDIRKIVFASPDFANAHKVRLLNRTSAMEAEVHKQKGRFDVFLGAMVDFGEAAGQIGKDIKPLTDRVAEVVGIARKSTKEYEQLPAPEDVELLMPPEEDVGALGADPGACLGSRM